MQVEDARQEDCRAVAELQVRSWQLAYAGILPAAYLDALRSRPSVWEQAIATGQPPLIVARYGERLERQIDGVTVHELCCVQRA